MEQELTYHQIWLQNNPDYYRLYREKNKEKIKEYRAKYLAENYQKIKKYNRIYHKMWNEKKKAEVLAVKIAKLKANL